MSERVAPRDGRFALGRLVDRACRVEPYDLKPDDPQFRRLRIFALDPAASRLHGNVADVEVPYEPLEPGPVGRLFEVDTRSFGVDGRLIGESSRLNLDGATRLRFGGLEPTQSDPQFHAQMVYAVCSTLYRRFREALGRNVAWGFDAGHDDDGVSPLRLRLRPVGMEGRNAYYEPQLGEIVFGYYPANRNGTVGRSLPRGYVFTALAHDVVAHECTHALLDGLRAHFTSVTHLDVAAFHEGFADIVALLHRFSHRAVVREALRASRGRLDTEHLTAIGRQFGETSGSFGPIRNAIDYRVRDDGEKIYAAYDSTEEPHERGRFLCGAIYEAFVTIFERKTARFVRLAAGPAGFLDERAALPVDLLEILTDAAVSLAGQFLNICIRAIDYCPPVDVRFGDFLRAVITADREMVPDDPYGYREAWIDAFQRRRIFPDDIPNLGEDALAWRPPQRGLPCADELTFAELAFDGDPSRVPRLSEVRRQAAAVGRLVTDPEFLDEFGLHDPSMPPAGAVSVGLPTVESVRVARRVGPDRNVVFDLVSEVTQRVEVERDGVRVSTHRGSTVLIDPFGHVRFIVRKRFHSAAVDDLITLVARHRIGSRYWTRCSGQYAPLRSAFRVLHEHAT